MNIKVCGMRDKQNVVDLCKLPITYIGFIFFAKSPRFVGDDFDVQVTDSIPTTIKKTGVFVNASIEYIESKITKYGLHAIQLHGSESPEFCKAFSSRNIEVIKAFGIDTLFDFTTLLHYESVCDYYLFDTKAPSHGGTGQKFDWNILKEYKDSKPFFLSGGITIDDIDTINNLTDLPIHCLDLNSKFEISPALKDIVLIKEFIRGLKVGKS